MKNKSISWLFTAMSILLTVPAYSQITGLSGAAGSENYSWGITVPSGQTKLVIRTSGGSGDCDLYVKFNSYPSRFSYNACSKGNNNNEIVTIYNPAPGRWHILLYGWSSYSGLTLSGYYENTATKTVVLIHGRTDDQTGYWKQLPTQLAMQGYQVKQFTWTKSTGSFSSKAAELNTFINNTGASSVDVVAHSLGVVIFRECIRSYSSIRSKVGKAVLMAGPSYGVDLDGPAYWWSGLSSTIRSQITPGSDFIWSLHNGGSILTSSKVLQILGGRNFANLITKWNGMYTYGNADGLVAGISARISGFNNERIVNQNHVQMVNTINNTSAQSYVLINNFFNGTTLPPCETARFSGGGLMAKCYDNVYGRSVTDPYIKLYKGWGLTYTQRYLKRYGTGNSYAGDQDWGQGLGGALSQPIPAGTYQAKRFAPGSGSPWDQVVISNGRMTVDPYLFCQ